MAALLAGSSFALLLYAARAYVDEPFLALVLWAGALEAERSARAAVDDDLGGRAVWILLILAGLLRPEAWLLGGAYWLWLSWRARQPLWRDPRAAAGRARHLVRGRRAGHRRPALQPALHLRPRRRAQPHALVLRGPRRLRLVPGRHRAPAGRAGRRRGHRRRRGAAATPARSTSRSRSSSPARSPSSPRRSRACRCCRATSRSPPSRSACPRATSSPAHARCSASPSSPGSRSWSSAPTRSTGSPPSCASSAAPTTTSRRCCTRPQVATGRRCGAVTLPNYRLVPDTRWILRRLPEAGRLAQRRPARARRRAAAGRREAAAPLRLRRRGEPEDQRAARRLPARADPRRVHGLRVVS